jgi:uncharacterized membrane protein YdbT with pleckstrin-like domain
MDATERVWVDTRRHGIVLARPFAKAFALAALGGLLYSRGWPYLVLGAALAIGGAVLGLQAVWRWDRTRVVVTTRHVIVTSGTVRRKKRSAPLGAIDVEQSFLGRLLGYGTLITGGLAIDHIPQPRQMYGLVERLTG